MATRLGSAGESAPAGVRKNTSVRNTAANDAPVDRRSRIAPIDILPGEVTRPRPLLFAPGARRLHDLRPFGDLLLHVGRELPRRGGPDDESLRLDALLRLGLVKHPHRFGIEPTDDFLRRSRRREQTVPGFDLETAQT